MVGIGRLDLEDLVEAGVAEDVAEVAAHAREAQLPLRGGEALLGLQLSVALMQGFWTLPPTARLIYLVSLGLMVVATILLMTPAAYL